MKGKEDVELRRLGKWEVNNGSELQRMIWWYQRRSMAETKHKVLFVFIAIGGIGRKKIRAWKKGRKKRRKVWDIRNHGRGESCGGNEIRIWNE